VRPIFNPLRLPMPPTGLVDIKQLTIWGGIALSDRWGNVTRQGGAEVVTVGQPPLRQFPVAPEKVSLVPPPIKTQCKPQACMRFCKDPCKLRL